MFIKLSLALLLVLSVSRGETGSSDDCYSVCPVVDFFPFDNEQMRHDQSLCGQTISEPVTLTGHLDCGPDTGLTVDAGGVLDCAGYTVIAGSDDREVATMYGPGIVVQNGGKVKNCRFEGPDKWILAAIQIGEGDNKVTNCRVEGNEGGRIENAFFVRGNGKNFLKCCKAQGAEVGFGINPYLFAQTIGQTTVCKSVAEDCDFYGFYSSTSRDVTIFKGIEVNGSGNKAIRVGRNSTLKRIKITHAGAAEAIDIEGSNNNITGLDIQVSGGVDGIRFRNTTFATNNVLKKVKVVAQDGGKCIVLNDDATNQIKLLKCTEL